MWVVKDKSLDVYEGDRPRCVVMAWACSSASVAFPEKWEHIVCIGLERVITIMKVVYLYAICERTTMFTITTLNKPYWSVIPAGPHGGTIAAVWTLGDTVPQPRLRRPSDLGQCTWGPSCWHCTNYLEWSNKILSTRSEREGPFALDPEVEHHLRNVTEVFSEKWTCHSSGALCSRYAYQCGIHSIMFQRTEYNNHFYNVPSHSRAER